MLNNFRSTIRNSGLFTAFVVASTSMPLHAERMSDSLPQPPSNTTDTALTASAEPLIQLAILLDTSGSMEGLVDQARCQLWTAVSRVSQAKKDGAPARLEIAVYQYGTEFVSKSKGALRQICAFTDDLDEVSAALFGLQVKGGEEYCGEVILRAIDDLSWSPSQNVYKAIFIAGNESFQQGNITFGQCLPELAKSGVVVNSIFCQSQKYRDDGTWKLAAEISGGRYSVIDHNHHLPNIPTPMDEQLVKLNDQMNETFVWYGKGSNKARENQHKQDSNSHKHSAHAFAARMSSKIGHLYHHVDHDLVDAIRHGKVDLAKMPESKMPEKLQMMSAEERLAFVQKATKSRQSLRRRMAEVISKRHVYLMGQLDKSATNTNVLGEALTSIIADQASRRGFTFADDVAVSLAP